VARGLFRNVSKTRGLLRIFVDCGLILDKIRGLLQRGMEYLVLNYFLMEKGVDSVHGSWTTGGAGPQWTADRASAVAHRSSA
jgi:hypothetical protein